MLSPKERLALRAGIVSALLLAIICALVWSTQIWFMISCAWTWLNNGSMEPETNGAVLRNLALVAAAVLGLVLATWRSRTASRQARATQDLAVTAERGHQNERYQTGANMLGDKTLATKLGGIYALTRLAQEHSEEYHFQIMMLFNTFVKDHKDHGNTQGTTECPPDIKAAVQALGHRNASQRSVESMGQGLHINLSDVNLKNMDLTNAHLANANLANANLADADLTNANLTNAVLTDADLTNAILKTAELKDCKLVNANLESAKLENANLEGADLSHANLREADLHSATITRANLFGARLDKAVLQGAVLTHARLEGAVLMEAKAMDANLAETDLTNAILAGADLTNVDFANADITGTILSESKGLTQEAIEQARATDWIPPILNNVFCSKTGRALAPPSRSTT